jgi:hypothetical protein
MVNPTELVQNTIEAAREHFSDSIAKPKDAEILGADFQGYLTLFSFGDKAYVMPCHKLDLREITQEGVSEAVVRDYGNGPAISGFGSGGSAMYFVYGNGSPADLHYVIRAPQRFPLPKVRGEEAKKVFTAVGITADVLYWAIFPGRVTSEEERIKLLKEHGFENTDIKEMYKKLVPKQQGLIAHFQKDITHLKEHCGPCSEHKEGLEREQQRLELMLQA